MLVCGGGGLKEASPGPASRAVPAWGWQIAGGSPAGRGSRSERSQLVGLPGPFGIQRGVVCTRTRRVLPQQAPAPLPSLEPQAWHLGTVGRLLSRAWLRAAGYLKQGRKAS